MKIKLDQNLGERGRKALAQDGHDVCTAGMQNLGTASDDEIWVRCAAEDRILVTLDLDFADVLRFPPENRPGVAVLRVAEHRGSQMIPSVIESLRRALAREDIRGRLWVIEPGRVRIYIGSPSE